MEQNNTSDNEDDDIFSKIPDDIAELVKDIQDRDLQRQKAADIMFERAKSAISEDERDMWLLRAREMEDIQDEFKSQFPEVFPEDEVEP